MLRRFMRSFRTLAGRARKADRSATTDEREMVSVFDTTVSAINLGNAIIMDAVYGHLKSMFPNHFFVKLPHLDSIGRESIRYIQQSRYVFFGGTNSLSSEMEKYRQWGIDDGNAGEVRDVVLMGLGWWQYQGRVNTYTKRLLKAVLHPRALHSVRDAYTEAKLREAGFDNVINTSCPTTWELTENHCAEIPRRKAEHVLLTFTNYAQRLDTDTELLRILRRSYRRVFLWVQGPGDRAYAQRIDSGVEFLAPRQEALDALLQSDLDIDYVGTRLHAGIRALQFKRRAIIVATDNRAIEMGKDIGLEVFPRDDVPRIADRVNGTFETKLRIPHENIHAWKSQFRG